MEHVLVGSLESTGSGRREPTAAAARQACVMQLDSRARQSVTCLQSVCIVVDYLSRHIVLVAVRGGTLAVVAVDSRSLGAAAAALNENP